MKNPNDNMVYTPKMWQVMCQILYKLTISDQALVTLQVGVSLYDLV